MEPGKGHEMARAMRMYYEEIREMEQFQRENGSTEAMDKMLLKYKQKVREASRETETDLPYEVINGGGGYDSLWEKRLYKGEKWTAEEMEQYKRDEWMHICSPYDCTGRLFTEAIEVFNTPMGVVAYHFTGMDV